MTPERWRRITDVFQAALGREAALRGAFLDEACASDHTLRGEVDALLAAHVEAGAFGESPIAIEESTARIPLLAPDATVGPYRVVQMIGIGGMGVVYRAHDPRVGRDVAIKMLPLADAGDAERLRRFELEARAVGALNHPNLLTLYDVGTESGQPFLVTELLEGETLRAHLERGPLQPRRACEIAAEIARGLAATHAKDIVHRDLKPENIMVTRDGRVKILDFGIAKLRPRVPTPNGALLTAPTMVLGTVGYMAPEQVRGLPVDARADIFALGAILFELLTGRRAFQGASRTETLEAIVGDDSPELNGTRPIPRGVERIVQRCLIKDPDHRFQSALDLALALDIVGHDTLSETGTTNRRRVGGRTWLAAAGVLGLVAISVVAGMTLVRSPLVPVSHLTRFAVHPPAGNVILGGRGASISPDGNLLAFIGIDRGTSEQGRATPPRLFLQRLDEFDAVALPGTEGAYLPFFSPDGNWIGFQAGGKLKKVRVAPTGSPVELCDARYFLDAVWAPDNTIIFGNIKDGLQRVSAEGGEPQPLTTIDGTRHEIDHHTPRLLPGGKAVLFASHQGEGVFRVVVQSLESGERKVLIPEGFEPQYSATGHLVYANGSSLFAVPFDVDSVEVTGAPVKLIEDVTTSPADGYGNFDLSANGSLVFQPVPSRLGRTLTWVDRSGVETLIPLAGRHFSHPRLSPDGTRLAVTVTEAGYEDIWIYERLNETLRRFTLGGLGHAPFWTLDGQHLIYASSRDDMQEVVSQPIDNSAPPEPLLSSGNQLLPGASTSDARGLIYIESPPTDFDRLALVRLDGDRQPQRLVDTERAANGPVLSPDGRWLAYAIWAPGWNIYVQPFPGPDSRRQLLVETGQEPLWSRDGRELYYRAGDGFFALPFDARTGAAAGKPVQLFQNRYVVGIKLRAYDVSTDGQRFLVVKPSEQELLPVRYHIVLNWADELKQRVQGVK